MLEGNKCSGENKKSSRAGWGASVNIKYGVQPPEERAGGQGTGHAVVWGKAHQQTVAQRAVSAKSLGVENRSGVPCILGLKVLNHFSRKLTTMALHIFMHWASKVSNRSLRIHVLSCRIGEG